MLLPIPDMKTEALQPVMRHGLMPIFQGALTQTVWLAELVYVGFLLPCVTDLKKARTFALIAVGVPVVIMIGLTLVTVMVEGPLAGKFSFPFYSAVRYISIGGFLERIDPAILAIWVFGGFIKEAIFLWMFCICLSQLFGLQHYRAIVVPTTLLVMVGSLWTYPNITMLIRNALYGGQVMALTLLLLTTSLLVVDSLKGWIRKTA